MATIMTTRGPMDESQLQKRESIVDNEAWRVTATEYCLADCAGCAHTTGAPDAPSHFCNQHVHRSAHVTIKPKE